MPWNPLLKSAPPLRKTTQAVVGQASGRPGPGGLSLCSLGPPSPSSPRPKRLDLGFRGAPLPRRRGRARPASSGRGPACGRGPLPRFVRGVRVCAALGAFRRTRLASFVLPCPLAGVVSPTLTLSGSSASAPDVPTASVPGRRCVSRTGGWAGSPGSGCPAAPWPLPLGLNRCSEVHHVLVEFPSVRRTVS